MKSKLLRWKEDVDISYYNIGSSLGIQTLNPGVNIQRYCLCGNDPKHWRFPRPEMIRKIEKLTKGRVKANDLIDDWIEKHEEIKKTNQV